MNKSGDDTPEASPWRQNRQVQKLSRSTRSLLFNIEEQRSRRKRQGFIVNANKIVEDIKDIKQRLSEIELLMESHINETSHNNSVSNLNLTNLTFQSANLSAIWANLSATHGKLVEIENMIADLDTRLQITEMTTAEITEEMARTRSYLDHLKANMSQPVEEETNLNDTVVKVTEDEEELPPSKDLKAFQNYLKDIGQISRDDLKELGNQKEDFFASCTWQGTICDSR